MSKELEDKIEQFCKEHGDRRIQIALESACELCVLQFGVHGTIERLEKEIRFLKEFQ
jgi:hypothetical protein